MNHETQIEKNFIEILTQRENQWTFRNDIKTETALWDNLRGHINRINLAKLDGIPLTDKEFEQLKVEFKKEAFEATFNEKYRKRLLVIEQYWKSVIEDKLIPLKGEIYS